MSVLIDLIFASPLNMIFFIIAEAVFFLGVADIVNALLSHTRYKHFVEFIATEEITDELSDKDEEQ